MATREHLRTLAVFVLPVMTSAGCSLMWTRPPPANVVKGNLSGCSTSRWPVVGDGYLAVNTGSVALLAAAVALAKTEEQGNVVGPSWDAKARRNDAFDTLWIVAGVTAAATVGLIQSARYGLANARSCEVAQAEFYRTYDQQPEPPPAVWFPPRAQAPPGAGPLLDPAPAHR